jgi:hypothetical protein
LGLESCAGGALGASAWASAEALVSASVNAAKIGAEKIGLCIICIASRNRPFQIKRVCGRSSHNRKDENYKNFQVPPAPFIRRSGGATSDVDTIWAARMA